MLRKTLFNLHLIAGFGAAVFVVILGVTASVMALEEEIDHLAHRPSEVSPRRRRSDGRRDVVEAAPSPLDGGCARGVRSA